MARRGLGQPATVDELLFALAELPPVERARLARLLANGHTTKAVSALADATVWELTRTASYAEVAEQLGVSAAAVNKAVTAHRRRHEDG